MYLRAALTSGDPDEPLARLGRALLDAPERERLAAMRHQPTATGFLVGRALLRASLHAQVGPGPWRFALGERGKPSVVGRPDLGVNVSHTRGCVVSVLSFGADVGVDVEAPDRETDTDKLATRYFAPSEVDAFRSIADPVARRERFFALWTLKESYMKATGAGFAMPLASFSFAFDRGGRLCGFQADETRDPAWRSWCFMRGVLASEASAFPVAVCVRAEAPEQSGATTELAPPILHWVPPPYSQERTSVASAKISWTMSPRSSPAWGWK